MKTINQYISEKLHINNTTKIEYMYHPKDKDELIKAIQDKIEKYGLGTKEDLLDLNDIDTSKVTDMSHLFNSLDGKLKDLSKNGHFDISSWNISNVVNMENMFYHSEFNGNISNWDVSNVEDMSFMFAVSTFDRDISKWNVSKVENMRYMFSNSYFNGDISKWDVSNVKNMRLMFLDSPLENNPPKWYHEA